MRLRTQLILATLLLAILPLAVVIVYSYETSRRAIETAYRNEAARMTRQMNSRVAAIRSDLDLKLAAVSTFPLENLPKSGGDHPMVEQIVQGLGDSAALVDSLEFEPARIEVRVAPSLPSSAADHPASAEGTHAGHALVGKTASGLESPLPVPPAPPQPPEAVVIDIPNVPAAAFRMSPGFDEKMKRLGELAKTMTTNSAQMTPEERRALQAEMAQINAGVREELKQTREAHDTELRQAMQAWRKERALERERIVGGRRPGEATGAVAGDEPGVADTGTAAPPEAVAEETPPAHVPTTAAPARADAAEAVRSAREAVRELARNAGTRRSLTDAQRKQLAEREKRARMILGTEFNLPVRTGDKVVGHVKAQVSPDELIRRVLGPPTDEGGEIAFLMDPQGHVYARTDAEKKAVESLGIARRLQRGEPVTNINSWVVATSRVGELRVGAARRIGDDLVALRQTAARNFGYGLGLVAFALIGIIPLANHITRDVKLVTEGASRIAHGDLETRLPVRSRNEFGQLATAFNRMAADLSENQRRLLEEERARKEQELQQRLLGVEYERKAAELEEARRFQLSLLPKTVPQLDRFDIAAFTQTATEVGGDYYDFHVGDGGKLSVTIGDATGHGAKAGTMVTVIKTLFSGYGGAKPGEFLSVAAERIKKMELGRMAMALSIARFENGSLTIASAGMPPVFIHRAQSGTVDEIALEATPLGTLETEYEDRTVALSDGDTVLFMSDGFPELTDADGQQLGYVAAAEAFRDAIDTTAQTVVERLVDRVRAWHGDQPLGDDITFVAVKVKQA